jgi:hypothetical protein
MTPKQNILASARVAELKLAADKLAAAARPPAVVAITHDPARDRRRLLLLLAHERARNAKLLELLQE